MIALLGTAERTGSAFHINNYVFQRHAFAYSEAVKHLGRLVIELGCGTGYGMQTLAQHSEWVVGVDKYIPNHACLNPRTAFFKNRLPALTNIGDNSFDTVVCFQVIEHIKEDGKLLQEINRILRPGGKLLLTTPNKLMSLTRNPHHVREYTLENMESIIKTRFKKFELAGVYGNTIVMEYYEANKNNIAKLVQLDVFNLQYLLPSALLKIPYNIGNNINRWLLCRRKSAGCADIDMSDYFLDEAGPACLDFFVVAEKQ